MLLFVDSLAKTWESKKVTWIAGVEGELADMKVLSAEGRRGSGREGIRQVHVTRWMVL